jgi:hypothetical protein
MDKDKPIHKPYLIQKGEVRNPKGKPKGALSEKRKAWELIGESLMHECADKFMVEMNKLEGTAYINAYLNILEFWRPRLSRQEAINHNNNVDQVVISVTNTAVMSMFPDNFTEDTDHEDIQQG